MQIRCSYCDSDVALPDKFEKLELSNDEVRVDGELVHVCRETRARSARARATAIALRDQARATVEHCERLLSGRDVAIDFDAGVARYSVLAGGAAVNIHVAGDVDVASAESHARVLNYVDVLLEASALPVIVGMEDVTFFGSTGIAFLLQLKQLASDARVQFILRDVSKPVQCVLDATGLGDLTSDAGE